MELKIIKEHQKLDDEIIKKLQNSSFSPNPNSKPGVPNYLNIDKNYQASYFIGATWLSDDIALVVKPKIDKIDFIKIFETALNVDEKCASEYFAKCYGVDINSARITISTDVSMLTPLLILHYIHLLKRLVAKGLRKNYITKEENLKTKVKGRILLYQNLSKNVWQKRDDRVYCKYCEYSVDTPENRLLKKALNISKRMFGELKLDKNQDKSNEINQLLYRFECVSDQIELNEIKHFRSHKIYKEYDDALRVARMIVRRFEYLFSNDKERGVPPFWIDMSRLYEMYVYSRLLELSNIKNLKFQVDGHCRTAVDYTAIIDDEKWIMDAKYKPHYDGSNAGILDDIREISGYARDTRILGALGADENEVKCLIIHPKQEGKQQFDSDDEREIFENGNELLENINNMNEKFSNKLDDKLSKKFCNFYKLIIDLPKQENK